MGWRCDCGTQNELYNIFCKACNKKIPQCERNKVYRQELKIQLEEYAVLLKNSAVAKGLKTMLLNAKRNIKEILDGTKKEDLKYIAIPVIFFSIIILNIFIQIAGMKIDNARMQRQQRNVYYAERRAALNENVRLKIDYAINESGFFGEITPTNQEVREHLKSKKNHLLQKSQIAGRFVIENVKRGYEKCRLYLEQFL